jgi:hypothetical protein
MMPSNSEKKGSQILRGKDGLKIETKSCSKKAPKHRRPLTRGRNLNGNVFEGSKFDSENGEARPMQRPDFES